MRVNVVDNHTERTRALATELRAVVALLNRRLRSGEGIANLSASQSFALLQLEQSGTQSITELSRSAGVRPQSMGATIATLQSTGYVTSAFDPKDRRRTLVSLSAQGKAQLAQAGGDRLDALGQVLAECFGPHELADLELTVGVLQRIAKH
ncbi:MarR family transcriptional regulator [Thioclava sp. BHET1]|nr:MarR family transcriptional regulator [Thioclava sp. BHET1]